MAKLHDLLNQLNTAAHELKNQVVTIDCKILECQKQRNTLTSAPVSKADFLDYLKSDIHKKYEKSYFLKWGIQLNTVTMIATDELARQYRVKKAL
ncbi:hypothetical protein COW64_15885, partial [bacterium (Candidatus Blackallbacteria) CG18_big_fil_WC_8_21_14_2_50_49_26]